MDKKSHFWLFSCFLFLYSQKRTNFLDLHKIYKEGGCLGTLLLKNTVFLEKKRAGKENGTSYFYLGNFS